MSHADEARGSRVRTRPSRLATGIITFAVALAGVAGTGGPAVADIAPTPVPPTDRTATTVTGDALPTVQIDSGVVWSQAVVGNTVFAGGRFSQTRPAGATAGQQLTPRSNLLAYDLTTGELLPFNPQINGEVKVVRASPDGTRLYIGGSFNQVNGKARWSIAAFDVATGELLTSFQPVVGGSYVNAIAVSDDAVYVGGLFTQARGVRRTNLAAFDLEGNLTAWAPTTDTQVDSMVMAPSGNRVIIGGRFTRVNGAAAPCTAALDPVTGTSLPWAINRIITGGGSAGSGVMGLSTDGTYVYAAGWLQRSWYFEGAWAVEPETGQPVWIADGQGDQYDVFASGTDVYVVGHSHIASTFGGWPDMNTPGGVYQYSLALSKEARGTLTAGGRANLPGRPAPALVHWYPQWISGKATGMGQAGWSVEGNSEYVVVGGEFLGVNGQLQQGLARFAVPSIATSRQGPRLSATPRTSADLWENPTFTALTGGGRVTIKPNYDRDDRTLTYELYRSGTDAPVATTSMASDHWTRKSQSVELTDTSAQPNTTYSYTVKAVDSDGNSALSKPVTGRTTNFTVPLRAQADAEMSGMLGTFTADRTVQPQGTRIVSWAWDFGDGDAATEANSRHVYTEPGTYTVSLTVTNDRNDTSTTSVEVTAEPVVARDSFGRPNGPWGTAEIGGAWSTDRGATIADGVGQLAMGKATTTSAWLTKAQAQNTDLSLWFSPAARSQGGGTFLSTSIRHTDAGHYQSKLVLNADGTISVHLTKAVNGTETVLTEAILPEVTYEAGDAYRIRYRAVTAENGATDLQVRVWAADQEEPSTWFLRAQDDDPALRGPGSIGISGYLSARSTLDVQTVAIDDVEVTTP